MSLATVDPTVLAAERTLAAYLGYANVIEMQLFLVSWPCLEAFRALLLANPTRNGNLFPPFLPAEFESIPPGGGPLMQVLIEMRNGVEQYASRSPEYNRQRTAEAIGQMPAEIWLPQIESQTEQPPYPGLGPVQSGFEEDVAPLHRCLCILQYFNITHGSAESYQEWLDLHEEVPLEEMDVTETDMPWWMIPGV